MMKHSGPKTCLALLLTLSTLSFGAQADETSKLTSPEQTADVVEGNTEQSVALAGDVDQQVSLLQQLVIANAAEIRFGAVILEKARTKAAKVYGKTLVADHLQVFDLLRDLMEQKYSKVTMDQLVQAAQQLKASENTEIAALETTPSEQFPGIVLQQSKVRHARTLLILKAMKEQRNAPELRQLAEIIDFSVRKHIRMAELISRAD